jgi:hypothetical protein
MRKRNECAAMVACSTLPKRSTMFNELSFYIYIYNQPCHCQRARLIMRIIEKRKEKGQ